MNCPTCLEPVKVTVPLTSSIVRCTSCNNDIQVEEGSEAPTVRQEVAPTAVTTHSPVPQTVKASAVKTTETEKAESKFSFRILGSVLLLLVFCLASFLVAGTALAFYLKDFNTSSMLDIRSEFFNQLGISRFSEYTQSLAMTTIGKALVPGILALIALIAVSRRKQITAIAILTMLVAIGFIIGNIAPVVPIVCLILVCVPGRSQIWGRNAV